MLNKPHYKWYDVKYEESGLEEYCRFICGNALFANSVLLIAYMILVLTKYRHNEKVQFFNDSILTTFQNFADLLNIFIFLGCGFFLLGLMVRRERRKRPGAKKEEVLDENSEPTGKVRIKRDLFVYSTKRNTVAMMVFVILFLVVNPIAYWPHFFMSRSKYPYPLLLIFVKICILYCEIPCGAAALCYFISFNLKKAPAIDKIGDGAKIEDQDPDYGDAADYGYFDDDGNFHWYEDEPLIDDADGTASGGVKSGGLNAENGAASQTAVGKSLAAVENQ